MDSNTKNKNIKIITKILAWIGLIVITIFLCIIAYAMLTKNGRLALTFIVALIFVSILFWIGIKLYKDAEEYNNLKNKELEKENLINLSKMNTKNI